MKTRLLLTLLLCAGCLHPACAKDDPVDVRFPQLTAASKPVAEAYFAAYISKNWQALAAQSHEQLRFTDPTAGPVFGEKVLHEGREKTVAFFKSAYAPLTLSFQPLRVLHSGETALFEGVLKWSMKLPRRTIQTEMPIITVLQLQDGKVIEHRDYADYQPFIDAEVASRLPVTATAKP